MIGLLVPVTPSELINTYIGPSEDIPFGYRSKYSFLIVTLYQFLFNYTDLKPIKPLYNIQSL